MGKNHKDDKLSVDSQQEILDRINESMMTGEPLDLDIDQENIFADSINTSIDKMLEARDDLADSCDSTESNHPFKDTDDLILPQGFRDRCNSTKKQPVKEKQPDASFKGITIRRGVGPFNTAVFSDGARSITIDFNTLNEDEKTLPYDGENGIFVVSFIRLEEVMTNFYPTAIFAKSQADELFGKVVEYNSNMFHFYEYPDGTGNIVLGYYIDDTSVNIFIDIIHELYDNGHVISFLNALKKMAEQEGFTYRNCTDDFSKQMMLLKRYTDAKENFISEFMEEDDTEVDGESPAVSAYESLVVLPFETENPYISELLGTPNEDDSDTSEDTDDEELEEDEVESIPQDYPGAPSCDVDDENPNHTPAAEPEPGKAETTTTDIEEVGESFDPAEFFEEENPKGYPAKRNKKHEKEHGPYVVKRR